MDTITPPLSLPLRTAVLDFLNIDLSHTDLLPPDLINPDHSAVEHTGAIVDNDNGAVDLLDRLVTAYTQHVPWESAFRIAKRVSTTRTEDCPRWPEEFWQDAMVRGGGGTCFESNYAFFSLLRSLGYEGYLTINNMNEMCGCHTAIVLTMAGERWLVDVGIPLYMPIPLQTDQPTVRTAPFHTYKITPQGGGHYVITRDRHPHPYIFTLIDQPISDRDYRTATTNDYEANGHFLREVIISKVIGDTVWRFNGRTKPPLLESFGTESTAMPIAASIPQILSNQFSMDEQTLTHALAAVGLLT